MTEEEHFLLLLNEEAVEVAMQVDKVLRFGFEDREPGQDLTNRERLQAEILDLYAVVEVLEERGILKTRDFNWADRAMLRKKAKIAHFVEYSRARGKIEERTK